MGKVDVPQEAFYGSSKIKSVINFKLKTKSYLIFEIIGIF